MYFLPAGWWNFSLRDEGVFDRRVSFSKALAGDVLNQTIIWSYLIPWLTGRYPQEVVSRPFETYMPPIALFFLLDLLETRTSVPCVSIISPLSPSFEKYWRDMWLIIYSLKYPIRSIRSPYFSIFSPLLTDHWGSLVMDIFSYLCCWIRWDATSRLNVVLLLGMGGLVYRMLIFSVRPFLVLLIFDSSIFLGQRGLFLMLSFYLLYFQWKVMLYRHIWMVLEKGRICCRLCLSLVAGS